MSLDDKLASERLRGRVEYWKQIAAIQAHFNDMCIRTRWLGLTAIATLVGAAAIAAKEDIRFRLTGTSAPILVLLPGIVPRWSLLILREQCGLEANGPV